MDGFIESNPADAVEIHQHVFLHVVVEKTEQLYHSPHPKFRSKALVTYDTFSMNS
jgi:hypothetical protein